MFCHRLDKNDAPRSRQPYLLERRPMKRAVWVFNEIGHVANGDMVTLAL
jgi:hypothetical protein